MVYNPKVTIDRIGNRIEKSDISIQEFWNAVRVFTKVHDRKT